ncbi:hypothetical protein CLV28_0203 [Sediminihabitans luteus]|uniref:Uncharacterized protein n=1 Tax=Sediminihabitans luteus TaxID=1138585 RepID=A0A2M9CYH7_9CELL|nr:hypothetical protein [Sediminihabitans luteus]PJJ76991.1 hypothetical protein CLV28_0203 [Sediminihabitans luteus]GII99632.1 hypothetical protein Slu03_20100 [Sediminihabitans luteus]
MSHLGALASALVDGQLSPAAAERAVAHTVRCERCAAEVADVRAARRSVGAAAPVVPADDLVARILAMAPEPAGDSGREAGFASDVPCQWYGTAAAAPRRRRLVPVVALGASGVLLLSLAAVGGAPRVTVPTTRAEARDVLSQAGAPGGTALDPGTSVDDVLGSGGWVVPTSLGTRASLTGVRLPSDDDGWLELDLTVDGHAVLVRERHGALDPALVAAHGVDERGVVVVSEDPLHAVWQSGGDVVELLASGPDEQDAVGVVVAAFPAHDYDAGVPARIWRGWSTMTGALDTP